MDQILLKNKIKQIRRARAWHRIRPALVVAGRVAAGLIIGAGWFAIMWECAVLNIMLNQK